MSPIQRQTFTPRDAVRILFVVILTGSFAYYAYFQAHNLILGPSLVLSEEPPQLQQEMLLEIRGTAENVVTLTVNGKPITTNERGAFIHPVVLEQGYTVVTLLATDRYGRTAALTRSFVYQPQGEIGV